VQRKTAMMKMMMIRQESSARPLIALIRCWWWSRDLRDFLSLVRSLWFFHIQMQIQTGHTTKRVLGMSSCGCNMYLCTW